MHVDWNWIKQRPHFLAEGLSSAYDVLVLYHYLSDRSVLVRNSTTVKHVPIPRFPLGRFALIAKANVLLQKIFFKVLLKIYDPDIVWITFPSLYNYVVGCDMRNRLLVYDCMDDAVEFHKENRDRRNIHEAEQCILKRADMVLASSQNLFAKLLSRGANPETIVLIRNAFDRSTLLENTGISASEPPAQNTIYKICFVGSVGEHIDFDAILFCIDRVPSVEFHFIGPVVCDVPMHERLFYHGQVNHAELARIVRQYDGLILPFKVNDLIRGVDPVKLYDYINFNKNIISVYYDEIRRFDNFVFFYHNPEGLAQIIRHVSGLKEIKYSPAERRRFLTLNSWAERVPSIVRFLEQHGF